jgi:hypothetical protein
VRVLTASGQTQTVPSGNQSRWVQLNANQAVANLDFGIRGGTTQPPVTGGSLSGIVWNDVNGNAFRDSGDNPLSGVTVYLDSNYNNQRDGNEPSTTTNASGAYSFGNLSPAVYAVRVLTASGQTQTVPTGNQSRWVQLNANQAVANLDFGIRGGTTQPPVTGGSISGKVFRDSNRNTIQDGSESGFSGLTVYLDQNYNNQLDAGERTATTDGSGNFGFAGLSPATYAVRVVLPGGFSQTNPNSNQSRWISLSTNQVVGNVVFGVGPVSALLAPTGTPLGSAGMQSAFPDRSSPLAARMLSPSRTALWSQIDIVADESILY